MRLFHSYAQCGDNPRRRAFVLRGIAISSVILASSGAHAAPWEIFKGLFGQGKTQESQVQASRPSAQISETARISRPYAYEGPARPRELKTDQYLSIWPADGGEGVKVYTADLEGRRANGSVSYRGWSDLELNKISQEERSATLPVFAMPSANGEITHKTLKYFSSSHSGDLILGFRVQNEGEARAAFKFLGGKFAEFKPEFFYMRATPTDRSYSHDAVFSEKFRNGLYEEEARPVRPVSEVFHTERRHHLHYQTPPSEGFDFVVIRIPLDEERANSTQQLASRNVLTRIFRKLAADDLIFVYDRVIGQALEEGRDLKISDKTAVFVDAEGRTSTVRIHGNFENLNQTERLTDDQEALRYRLDVNHLGAIPFSGGYRPVLIGHDYNGLRFTVRVASEEEASQFAGAFRDYFSGVASVKYEDLALVSRRLFDHAVVSDKDRFVTFSLVLHQLSGGNSLVSAKREIADIEMFMVKNFGMRLADADLIRLSFEEFSRTLASSEPNCIEFLAPAKPN